MKKVWIYIAGIITGFILTVLISLIITDSSNTNAEGVTMFSQTGDRIDGNLFEVFQVLDTGAALANLTDTNPTRNSNGIIIPPNNLVVVIINDDGKYYYDDEIIKIPCGKCARQVGIYKYTTNMGGYKTVPIVKICDNN